MLGNVATQFESPLEFDPASAPARRGRADLWFDRFVAAERDGAEPDELQELRALVEAVDDGRHARELEGAGALRIATDPPGAEVFLSTIASRERALAERLFAGGDAPELS